MIQISLFIGAFIIPTIDLLVDTLKSVLPSFKKKKGKIAKDIEEV